MARLKLPKSLIFREDAARCRRSRVGVSTQSEIYDTWSGRAVAKTGMYLRSSNVKLRAKEQTELFEKDLGHHAFVFMVQQVAMKHRHAADGGIGEIHDHVD